VGCTLVHKDLRQQAEDVSPIACPTACPSAVEIDAELAQVVVAWPKLAEGIKQAVLAIVKASSAG